VAKRRITRVTTRRGDAGETSLADGLIISKTDAITHAIGSVDELNSFVGLLVTELDSDHPLNELTARLQQELFDLGAHLATSGTTPVPDMTWLDEAVASLNEQLPPLTEFVIPGGNRAAAFAHVCRTVCRRAERDAWSVDDALAVARYLNRLSDLLFVMARGLARGAGTGSAGEGQEGPAGEEPQWRGLS